MSSYENSSLTEIETILDGLDEATALQVFDATRGYAPRAIASVAASRADASAGASFPPEWTIQAGGGLIIETTESLPFYVQGLDDTNLAISDSAFTASIGDGTKFIIGSNAHRFRGDDGTDIAIFGKTQIQLSPDNGTVDVLVDTGELRLGSNAAIADADLFNGAFHIWLNTATSKIMCKAKIADVVVTGELGTLA